MRSPSSDTLMPSAVAVSLASTLVLALAPALLAARRDEPAMPRKTGNLSITSYRAELMKGGKPEPLDPMLREPEVLQRLGFTWVEDYVTLDVFEPVQGKMDVRPYVANARACRRLGIDYAIYPWLHFYPDWVEKEPGFVPYKNLQDGSTCRQPSGWAPHTRQLTARFYASMARQFGRYVTAVYVTDCAEYGELGYPNGYTKWLRKDDNAKPAWWCGDDHARADFRVEQLRCWGKPEQIGARWGTLVPTANDLTYPPIELLKSNPDPRKLTPQQRRWILDFVYWYQDASPRRMQDFIRAAQEALPDRPCEIKLGHADESAIMGQSYSSACRILRNTPRLAIHSTHAGVSYFHIKRVATPARFYGFKQFLTEPPGNFVRDQDGTIKPQRMAERIFTDACAGVTAYFDYLPNPTDAGEVFTQNIGLLDGKPATVDVALLFPEADHYLRIDQPYPKGLLECANAIRDVADFDVVDERLIAGGILKQYPVLVIVGDPLIEESTWLELRNRVRRQEVSVIVQVVESPPATPAGSFECIDGQTRPLLPPRPDTMKRVIGKPDGDQVIAAVQSAYADALKRRGLKDDQISLLTARDQVWAALFDRRILAYNTTDGERTVNRAALAGRHILEIERKH